MRFLLLIFLLLIGNLFAWWNIWQISQKEVALYFLNVGQGDSQLIQLDDVQILIDGGPDASVLRNLEKIMPAADRYIDLVILTHPQLDHFGGLIDVLERYEVGAFIENGREGTARAFKKLQGAKESALNNLTLAEGDKITYKDFTIHILSPSQENLKSKELNSTSIVALLETPEFKALYTGDIGFDIEDRIRKKYKIQADVLKIPHHGSKYSSGNKFLREIKPKISVIGVGKNSYGHPNPLAINRIKQTGSLLHTTLESGLIKILSKDDQLRILSEK